MDAHPLILLRECASGSYPALVNGPLVVYVVAQAEAVDNTSRDSRRVRSRVDEHAKMLQRPSRWRTDRQEDNRLVVSIELT